MKKNTFHFRLPWIIIALLYCTVGFAQNYQLSLPWSEGDDWWLHHGVHASKSSHTDTLSSLDFAPGPGVSTAVRAARGGWVVAVSNNHCWNYDTKLVVLKHEENLYTSYYHLTNIPNKIRNPVGNVWINRGEFIGNVAQTEAEALACNIGSWGAPHVHMTVRSGVDTAETNYIHIVGEKIGGYEVLNDDSGDSNRKSGIKREGLTIHRPPNDPYTFNRISLIHNDGSIGTGEFADYPYCDDDNLDGSYGGGSKIIVKANRDITSSAYFYGSGTKAKIIAGRQIILPIGVKVYLGATAVFRVDPFACNNGPNIIDQNPNAFSSIQARKKEQNFSFKAIPNPFHQSLTLTWSAAPNAGVSTLKLTSLSGHTILQKDWSSKPQYNSQLELRAEGIDLEHLPAGIYFVQIQLENGASINRKIIKTN